MPGIVRIVELQYQASEVDGPLHVQRREREVFQYRAREPVFQSIEARGSRGHSGCKRQQIIRRHGRVFQRLDDGFLRQVRELLREHPLLRGVGRERIRQVRGCDLLVGGCRKERPHRVGVDAAARAALSVGDTASRNTKVREKGYVRAKVQRPVDVHKAEMAQDLGDVLNDLRHIVFFVRRGLYDGDIVQRLDGFNIIRLLALYRLEVLRLRHIYAATASGSSGSGRAAAKRYRLIFRQFTDRL